MRKVILAGAGSGSGKTVITCGILKCLKDRGLSVHSYKCGPDYIDPMFHKSILGIPSDNIDTYFSDEDHLNKLIELGAKADISVIEGVMGIYDGLGGISGEGSAYDLAQKTDTNIVLIFPAKGMGRTMISLIKGILMDDTQKRIKGIILNRISSGYFEVIAPFIEKEAGVQVIGYLPEIKDIRLESRHLGLKKPEEIEGLEAQLDIIARQVSASIDMDAFMEIAKDNCRQKVAPEPERANIFAHECKLAVAKDEAFCFYYEENLRLLEAAGAEIVFFSPLHDRMLPEGATGILLGGGYPELKLKELADNKPMRESILAAIRDGMPSYAECGGFMYLHDAIIGEDDKEYKMVGAIAGKCFNTGKLCRFGYVDVNAHGLHIKGHEFHYFDSTANGSDAVAKKPLSQKEWKFGYVSENRFWGYPHLYYGSNTQFPKMFVEAMKKYQNRNRRI